MPALSRQRATPRATPALRAEPGGQGPGSGEHKHFLLIQLFPAEHSHRRGAFGAVSEPAAIMLSHGDHTGQQLVPNLICPASGRISCKDIQRLVRISRDWLGYLECDKISFKDIQEGYQLYLSMGLIHGTYSGVQDK